MKAGPASPCGRSLCGAIVEQSIGGNLPALGAFVNVPTTMIRCDWRAGSAACADFLLYFVYGIRLTMLDNVLTRWIKNLSLAHAISAFIRLSFGIRFTVNGED